MKERLWSRFIGPGGSRRGHVSLPVLIVVVVVVLGLCTWLVKEAAEVGIQP